MGNLINWVGIDDHADKWTISHYVGGESEPRRVWELEPTDSGYRKLIGWMRQMDGAVRVVYEAGPCGYELYRRLVDKKISCEVAAPSLTPRKPGDRIKTNRRDASRLAHLYRAGELTLIVVPDRRREAVRDLVRAREAVKHDLQRGRQQLNHFLLRQGHRYRDGGRWTQRHWAWITATDLTETDAQNVKLELQRNVEQRLEQLQRYDALIEQIGQRPEYSPYVQALRTLRGIDTFTAVCILAELGDLRRFATAPQLMAAVGLVPSEYSTGNHTRRYGITKTGNAHVRYVAIEAAWHFSRPARAGGRVCARRKGQPAAVVDIARRCDLRLHRKFHRLTSRGKPASVAVTAVARELVGFIWAIGQQIVPT